MRFSACISVVPFLTCSVAPIRVTIIPLRSRSLPLTIPFKYLAFHTTATPSSFWTSRFTCHRFMAYALSVFPARPYNKVVLGEHYNHRTLSSQCTLVLAPLCIITSLPTHSVSRKHSTPSLATHLLTIVSGLARLRGSERGTLLALLMADSCRA
jgi:hypothetical protein